MPCLSTYGPNHEMRVCEPDRDNPDRCKYIALTGAMHKLKCAIQWVGEDGNPTPDYNDAIGIVHMPAHTETTRAGNTIHYERSRDWPICAEHAKHLSERGMHIWKFRSLNLCPLGCASGTNPCGTGGRDLCVACGCTDVECRCDLP